MKKTVRLLVLILGLLILLTACGSSASVSSPAGNHYADTMPETGMYAEEPGMYAEEAGMYAEEAVAEDWDYDMDREPLAVAAEAPAQPAPEKNADGLTEGTPSSADLSEKIIYSAYAEVETLEFDQSVDAVYAMMDQYGAFIENSSVTGSNLTDSYYGYSSTRTADFTLRVPKERYFAMTTALDGIGNVTYLSSSADNITAQYTDTSSRLAAYEVEEQRLLDILAQAETVEDMITVESRLSDIRYEKEYLTSSLRNWDNQVDYSTVSLHLREVRVLTPEPEEEKGYWEQVGEGFMDTLRSIGNACMEIFRFFVAAIPVLLILAVIILIIVLLIRRAVKKHARNRSTIQQVPAAPGVPVPPSGAKPQENPAPSDDSQ